MGVNESKNSKNKKQLKTTSNGTTDPAKGNVQSKIKHVLLLYRVDADDKKQLDVVDAFGRALVNAGLPHIDIKHKVNVATAKSSAITEDVEWLNDVNNVILIRLSPDVVADLERIIREKRFVGDDGVLNDKIMAVSFGKELPQGWPPRGMKRRPRDHKKDFCFEFEDESLLSRKDFKTDSAKKTLNSIVTALLAAHGGDA